MSQSPTTFADIIAPFILLAIVLFFYLIIRSPRPNQHMTSRGSVRGGRQPASAREGVPPVIEMVDTEEAARPRMLIAYADNPSDHPYDELPLSTIIEHLYDQHWEVVNSLADKDPSPSRWRREHAADHGLVIR